jgi:nucleoside-diphosphate-sugar epimerase
MKTVLITGASGFIGSALVRAFAAKGWRVVGAGRTRPPALPEGVEWRAYDLAWTSLPDDFFEGVDAVVHGAMMKQSADERSFDINVAAGKLLLDRAHQRDITRVAFLSSLAAHDGALSQYGKQKYVLERHYDQRGALVVRPGLVLGNGGLFASMCDYLRSHRYMPLIGGGNQPLQTIYIDDLAQVVYEGMDRGTLGVFTAAEAEPVSYRTFYEALSARLGVKVTFVPVSFWAIDLALRCSAAFRIKLPLDRDNLLGLQAMRKDARPRLQSSRGPIASYDANLASALSLDDKSARR